ncbi:MAG TPA: hypothetical protein VK196_15885 [Magnetospirillum sp.]|nr:hypothetical protein [Magnetospirillum sp.]
MPALDAGIHVRTPNALLPMTFSRKHVDRRVKPGDDVEGKFPRDSAMNLLFGATISAPHTFGQF